MKRLLSIFLATLFVLLMTAPEASAAVTGLDLQRTCGSVGKRNVNVEEVRDINFCLGYISAYIESHYEIYLLDEDRGFCLDPQTPFKKAAQSVNAYLATHPEILEQKAYFALDASLKSDFPCHTQ